MAERYDTFTPERRFAEHMGIVGAQVGMPPMVARVLGWLLICDPPQQSLSQLAAALEVSRASVSIATRLLEAPGWIRRAAVPGGRGHYFEIVPNAFTRMPAAAMFSLLRQALEEGLAALPDAEAPRAQRLRQAHEFYAYVESEVPRMIERYRLEKGLDVGTQA